MIIALMTLMMLLMILLMMIDMIKMVDEDYAFLCRPVGTHSFELGWTW